MRNLDVQADGDDDNDVLLTLVPEIERILWEVNSSTLGWTLEYQTLPQL
jgi:hypothetical protein